MSEPAQTAMTLDDLYRLPDNELLYELVNGWLVSEPPPGVRHGRVAGRIVAILDACVRQHGAGVVVTCDTGFVLHRSPDTVRAPDVAFIRMDRYLAMEDDADAMPGPPDLAVEVLSPGNRPQEIHAKVADYLAAGTTLVWVVDPQTEQVRSYRSLFEPQIHAGTDLLTAEDLLPEFSVPVADIFSI
ncbi:MAG: Uma2 family endonuclease [Gammaproteobacteria bacterium]|nr:Uma2 family endonuclease [Gammaproteobacteria bacterium]NNF61260.1 Uma2 family endonuclease [Gammaproteobacteria bacterium]NNM21708.1 Uma2 family endonuclease [Gammaproteobacteria bacterium]